MPQKKFLTLQWHITDYCDLRCKHCYIYSNDNGKQPENMPLNMMLETVDRCLDYAKFQDKELFFTLLGGDPLLHPDFWTLAEYLKQKKIRFNILGNPNHLTLETCYRLKRCGCIQYQVSLDGLRNTHDAIRQQGSFDATLACLRLINNSGMLSAVMTTVSHENIGEILDVIDLAVEHKASVYAFTRYAPMTSEKKNLITPLEYRDLLDKAYKKYEKYRAEKCRTIFDEKDHLFTLYRFEEGLEYKNRNCCTIGLSGCILPDGTLLACRRVPDTAVGNIFNGFFENEMMSYRDISRDEKCSKCDLVAWCRGCHAVSRGQFGSFYACDPQCWKK